MASSGQEHLLLILPAPPPPSALEHLRVILPTAKVTTLIAWTSAELPDNIDELYATATIVVGLRALPAPAQIPHARLIHIISAGLDAVWNQPILTEQHQIPVTNGRGTNTPSIAEWYALTVLAHFRQWEAMRSYQAQKLWQPNIATFLDDSRDLAGMTVGILGYGSIGRQIARVSTAFGMKVLAYTARPKLTPESRRDEFYCTPGTGDLEGKLPSQWFHGTEKASLHEFLRQNLDVLVVSMPLTDSTRNLLGKAEFDVLAEQGGCYLVNVARGEIINQDEFIEALNAENGLLGAAVDVASPEPLPADSPLWTAKRCLVTPHISPLTTSLMRRVFEVLAINLERLKTGEPLLNLVQKTKGY